MTREQKLIDEIIEQIVLLRMEIEIKAKLGLLDGNKHIENYMKNLLNPCYELNLINLNTEQINYPGVDLGDKNKKIAYQITSTKTSSKINKTLKAFDDNDVGNTFKKLKIFIVGNKQKSYSFDKELAKKIGFTVDDIFDIDDLVKNISTLSIDKLEIVHDYVSKNHFSDENKISKKEFGIIQSKIRLFKLDIEEIKDYALVLSKGNSVYNNNLSRIKNWEEKYIDINSVISPEQSENLIKFYRKNEFLYEISDAYKTYMINKYGGRYLNSPMLDPITNRYAKSYRSTLLEMVDILNDGLEEYLTSVLQ